MTASSAPDVSRPTPPPPGFSPDPTVPDEPIPLEAAASARFIGAGWWPSVNHEMWLRGPRGTLFFPANPDKRWIEIIGAGLLFETRKESQDIDVFVDGAMAGTISYRWSEHGTRLSTARVPIPTERATSPLGLRVVELVPHDRRSPHELGINQDDRRLAAVVASVRLTP